MTQQRRLETVEDFKLRIAAIIRAKPQQIPTSPRPRTVRRTTNRRRKTSNEELAAGIAPLGEDQTQKSSLVDKTADKVRNAVNWGGIWHETNSVENKSRAIITRERNDRPSVAKLCFGPT